MSRVSAAPVGAASMSGDFIAALDFETFDLTTMTTEEKKLSQAVDIDPVELYETRQAIRPTQENAAQKLLEETFQKQTAIGLLLNAMQDVARLLSDEAEERQARRLIMQRQRVETQPSVQQRKPERLNDWER